LLLKPSFIHHHHHNPAPTADTTTTTTTTPTNTTTTSTTITTATTTFLHKRSYHDGIAGDNVNTDTPVGMYPPAYQPSGYEAVYLPDDGSGTLHHAYVHGGPQGGGMIQQQVVYMVPGTNQQAVGYVTVPQSFGMQYATPSHRANVLACYSGRWAFSTIVSLH
jgi:hypothetical protein